MILNNHVKLKAMEFLSIKNPKYTNQLFSPKKLVLAHPSTLHSRISALSSYFDQHRWNFTPG